MSSLCGSIGSLTSSDSHATVRKMPPTSPTASVSESNVVSGGGGSTSTDLDRNSGIALSSQDALNSALEAITFDGDDDLDVEVQSPDLAIWEMLIADQSDSGVDFMISSPRRSDFMVCSPRRDFMMVNSPKREYLISSPNREFMVISSPKRDFMLISSPKRDYIISSSPTKIYTSGNTVNSVYVYNNNNNNNSNNNGLGQSPLQKMSNIISSSHTNYNDHVENLALPVIESFLEDYHIDVNDSGTGEAVALADDLSGVQCSAGDNSTTLGLPSLLECLSMPEPEFCDAAATGEVTATAAGLQIGCDDGGDLYRLSHHQFASSGRISMAQQFFDREHGQLQDATTFHGLLGNLLSAEPEQEQDGGLDLLHMLLACAEAVAKADYRSARSHLHRLRFFVSFTGDSMHRVAACFADALAARISAAVSLSAPPPLQQHPDEVLKIYQILYQACPYIKFAHFTANQAIFEAFDGESRLHVVDLDVLQGYQWPAFMQALAARPGGPPSLRITGVGRPAEAVRRTGRHLTDLARSLRLPFEFHAVDEPLESLRPASLRRRVGEALAVNAVNRLHRVQQPALGQLLSMLRDQAPSVVAVVEQEAGHGGATFLPRFLEALHYYSAVFDSLHATFPADSAARARVEQGLLAPEITNVVACEGAARVERHERLEKWRRLMEGRGFRSVPLSANAVNQSRILLGLYPCDGYRLREDNGCLLLGWQDRPIIAASSWRC